MSKIKPILILLSIVVVIGLLAGGAYAAGGWMLPNMINNSYTERNCASVIQQNETLHSFYPMVSTQDNGVAAKVNECSSYLYATSMETKKEWMKAHQAYRTYAETYPKGIFVKEAQAQGAQMLLSQAADQFSQKKYQDALTNLNQVIKIYPDSPATNEATSQITNIYVVWGTEFRDAAKFVDAESTFNKLLELGKKNNNTDQQQKAQEELAQTYLAWGQAVQSKKNYQEAQQHYEQATKADPNTSTADGPGAKAKSLLTKLFEEWGDSLLAEKKFSDATGKYNEAIALAPASEKERLGEKVNQITLSLIKAEVDKEDFLKAIDIVKDAQAKASDEKLKKDLEKALNDTYLAFSKSSGKQAQKAIADAMRNICDRDKAPSLPIFGLDQEKKLSGFYGKDTADAQLPDTVRAITPGTMHYVACVDRSTTFVRTAPQRVGNYLVYLGYQRVHWTINLKDIKTLKTVASNKFTGGDPAQVKLQNIRNAISEIISGPDLGSNPNLDEIATWILRYLK